MRKLNQRRKCSRQIMQIAAYGLGFIIHAYFPFVFKAQTNRDTANGLCIKATCAKLAFGV
jgi:hypothetical protein